MGYSSNQCPNSFHFLRLIETLLKGFIPSHITNITCNIGFTIKNHRVQAYCDGKRVAIFMKRLESHAITHKSVRRFFEKTTDFMFMVVPTLHRHQQFNFLTHELMFFITKHSLGTIINNMDCSITSNHKHSIRCGIQECPKLIFTLSNAINIRRNFFFMPIVIPENKYKCEQSNNEHKNR